MFTAVVRPPTEALAQCQLTHMERAPIDTERALAQHRAYTDALTSLGVRVVSLDPLPGAPDACFVEDAALVLPGVVIRPHMGAPSRRAEVESLHEAINETLDEADVERRTVGIEAPATLEGGDTFRYGDTVYVAHSTRTNAAGIEALRRAIEPAGLRVAAMRVAGALHLTTSCIPLGPPADDPDARPLLLANPAWVDTDNVRSVFDVLPIDESEPFAANVMRFGDTVLMSADAPRTADLISARGFEIRPLDISEFAKAEAGLTCLRLLFESRLAPLTTADRDASPHATTSG